MEFDMKSYRQTHHFLYSERLDDGFCDISIILFITDFYNWTTTVKRPVLNNETTI